MNHDKVDALLTQSGCRFEFLHDKDYEDFSPYKFAELIVKECANKVSQMVMMDKGYIPKDPHSVGWNSAVAYASEELKRYYGIEE